MIEKGLRDLKRRKSAVRATDEDGHFMKHSADVYKSKKGHGDILRKGAHEPFAYIKLNPKMLNKRNKGKAVQSFQGVIEKKKKNKLKL